MVLLPILDQSGFEKCSGRHAGFYDTSDPRTRGRYQSSPGNRSPWNENIHAALIFEIKTWRVIRHEQMVTNTGFVSWSEADTRVPPGRRVVSHAL